MRKSFLFIFFILLAVSSCKEEDEINPFANFTSETYEFDYQARTIKVGVQCLDAEWTFELSEDWATSEVTGGTSSATFDVYLEANTGADARVVKGILHTYVSGVSGTDTVYIEQSGEYPLIVLEEDSIEVVSAASVVPVEMQSNHAWSVKEKSDWLNVAQTKVFTDYTLSLEVAANPDFGYREGFVTFVQDGYDDTEKTLYVLQYGKGGVETDSLALVDLYNATGGAQWTNKWDLSQPVDSWYGVKKDSTIQGVRIVSLDLANNNLAGVLPASLPNVVYLEDLILNDNAISGAIPSNIGDMKELANLYLSNNQITGLIPESLGQSVLLSRIYLQNNQLSGSIPETLGNISLLESLALNDNNLEGELPESVGGIETLFVLTLNNNRFSGTIPNSYINNENATSWNAKINICKQQDGYGFINCDKLYSAFGK